MNVFSPVRQDSEPSEEYAQIQEYVGFKAYSLLYDFPSFLKHEHGKFHPIQGLVSVFLRFYFIENRMSLMKQHKSRG